MTVDLNEKQKIPIHSYQHDKIKLDQLYKNIETKIYTFNQYGIFGEEHLLNNENRTYSVICESFGGQLLVIQASEFLNKVMKFSPEIIQMIQKQKAKIFQKSYDLQKKNMDKYSNYIIENRCEAMNQLELKQILKTNGSIIEDQFKQIDLQYRINSEFHDLKHININKSLQSQKKDRSHSFYRRKMYQQLLNNQKNIDRSICNSPKSSDDPQTNEIPDLISSIINKKKEVFLEKSIKVIQPEQFEDIVEISPRTRKVFDKRQSHLKPNKKIKSIKHSKRSSVQILENIIRNSSSNHKINDCFFKEEDEDYDDDEENKIKDGFSKQLISIEEREKRTLSADEISMKNIEKLLKRRDSIATRLTSQHTDTSHSQLIDENSLEFKSKDLYNYPSRYFIKHSRSKDNSIHLPQIKESKSLVGEQIKNLQLQIDDHSYQYGKQDKVLQKYIENKNIRSSSEHNYVKLSVAQYLDPCDYKLMCNNDIKSRYLQANQKRVNMQSAIWQYNIQQLNKSKQVINQALNNIKQQNDKNKLKRSIPIRVNSQLS